MARIARRPDPILKRLFQTLRGSSRYDDERHTLDHVPFKSSNDWRTQRLAEAALRHGKPFKCAGVNMPREVLTRG